MTQRHDFEQVLREHQVTIAARMSEAMSYGKAFGMNCPEGSASKRWSELLDALCAAVQHPSRKDILHKIYHWLGESQDRPYLTFEQVEDLVDKFYTLSDSQPVWCEHIYQHEEVWYTKELKCTTDGRTSPCDAPHSWTVCPICAAPRPEKVK